MATTFFRATDADPDAELTPQSNAIYYTPTNAFNYRQPEVPTHVFDAELRQMLAQRGSSGLIALDLSREMGHFLSGNDARDAGALHDHRRRRSPRHRIRGRGRDLLCDRRIGHVAIG